MATDHQLSELQLATMRVLWERGEGTAADVQRALRRSRGLAVTTVATLLNRLEKRGVVAHRVDGRAFVYRATISEHDVRRSTLRSVLRHLFRGDPGALLSHLVSHADVGEDDIVTMRKLLTDARKAARTRGKA